MKAITEIIEWVSRQLRPDQIAHLRREGFWGPGDLEDSDYIDGFRPPDYPESPEEEVLGDIEEGLDADLLEERQRHLNDASRDRPPGKYRKKSQRPGVHGVVHRGWAAFRRRQEHSKSQGRHR